VGLTPGVLSDALEVSATSLSFHLKELTHSGLVSQERQGRNLIYRAAFEEMDGLLRYLTENCCAGETCLLDGSAAACNC
jgi:ArsR family transcriptional regulator